MKKATLARELVHPIFYVTPIAIKYVGLAMIFALSFLLSSCKKSIEDTSPISRAMEGPASLRSSTGGKIGVNIVLNTPVTAIILAQLKTFGYVVKTFPEINAITMITSPGQLAEIKVLQFVLSASPDAERKASPVNNLLASDFANGVNTWDLDAVNVTDHGMAVPCNKMEVVYILGCWIRGYHLTGGNSSRRKE